MRKLIFTLFVLGCVLGLRSQSLATFENVASDAIFVSDYGTSGDPFWYDDARFISGGKPQVGANPNKSGINISEKCVFAVNVADADWWGNFMALGFKTPVVITSNNKYLHMKVYRSIQPKDFRICINDKDCSEAGRIYEGSLTNDATWENIVCDLSGHIGETINSLNFLFSTNWNDPRSGWGTATYAFDDIVMSNSPLPPGVTVVDGNGLFVGFENKTEIDKWIQAIDVINSANTASIIDNSFGSADLLGNKIVQFSKSANASWWQGYKMDFKGIIAVGGDAPNVLHILTYIPKSIFDAENLKSLDIQLCAKDHLGNESTGIFTIWDDEINQWRDLVLEITEIAYLKELTVRFDLRKNAEDNYINSPANTFYLDALTLNKNSEPRVVTTGVTEIANSKLAIVASGRKSINITTDQTGNILLFNTSGQLAKSISFSGNTVIPAEQGFYILKISSGKERQITKVLVE